MQPLKGVESMDNYIPSSLMLPILNIIKGNLAQHCNEPLTHHILNEVSGKITQDIEEFLRDLEERRKDY